MKCPEQRSFNFVFKGKCPITTCQFCTDKTKNGCLAVDRKEANDRPITVAELQLYKGDLHPKLKTMNKKASEAYVRNTVIRVKDLTSLYMYIAWLDIVVQADNRRELQLNDVLSSFYQRLVAHLPEFRVWMLPYLFSSKHKMSFYNSDGKRYNIQKLNLGSALDIHVKRLTTILEAVKASI
jgi:hypothetical protein